MFVIRPAKLRDIDTLEKFANNTALSMISLPKNREFLEKKIAHSISSFNKKNSVPENEIYCFVMEDTQTREIGGCCAVYAKTGVNEPIYYYRMETSYPTSQTLPLPGQITVLKPMKLSHGPAELSMLYLKEEWRKEGLGELLSLSRFLFIAEHPHRIDISICARLRGVIHKQKETSPFWDGIGKNFIAIDFKRACELLQEDYPYTEEFLPEYPIYTNLLSKQTQHTIGRTHHSTRPALKMLKKEGFSLTSDIDLFDGGPILQAQSTEVRSVKKSQKVTVQEITTTPIDSPLYLVSNTRLDYRCCFANIDLNQHTIRLSKEVAESLNVHRGDSVRVVRL